MAKYVSFVRSFVCSYDMIYLSFAVDGPKSVHETKKPERRRQKTPKRSLVEFVVSYQLHHPNNRQQKEQPDGQKD